MFNNSILKKLGMWTGFLAIVTIIGGIVSCLTIVGIIPGAIAIFLGIKLWNAKRIAGELIAIQEGENAIVKVDSIFEELAMYFKVNGILLLISFGLSVIAIIIGFVVYTFTLVNHGFFYN